MITGLRRQQSVGHAHVDVGLHGFFEIARCQKRMQVINYWRIWLQICITHCVDPCEVIQSKRPNGSDWNQYSIVTATTPEPPFQEVTSKLTGSTSIEIIHFIEDRFFRKPHRLRSLLPPSQVDAAIMFKTLHLLNLKGRNH